MSSSPVTYGSSSLLFSTFTEPTSMPGFIAKDGTRYIFDTLDNAVAAVNSSFTGESTLTEITQFSSTNTIIVFNVNDSVTCMFSLNTSLVNPSEQKYVCFLSTTQRIPVGIHS